MAGVGKPSSSGKVGSEVVNTEEDRLKVAMYKSIVTEESLGGNQSDHSKFDLKIGSKRENPKDMKYKLLMQKNYENAHGRNDEGTE